MVPYFVVVLAGRQARLRPPPRLAQFLLGPFFNLSMGVQYYSPPRSGGRSLLRRAGTMIAIPNGGGDGYRDISCPRPREVLEESEAEAERADFPQSGQKRPQGDGERKDFHPRMAWLLRNCKHKDDHAGMGWLAAPENPDVYLEAMEEAENESGKPKETRRPGMASLCGSVFTQILLSAKHAVVNMAITSKRLAQVGYFSLSDRYESLHLCD